MLNFLAKILIVAALATMGVAVYNVYNNENAPIYKVMEHKYKTTKAESRLLKKEIDINARVFPMKEVKVSSEVPGTIEWIGVEEGDFVAKGQHIASIEHSELLDALKQAQAQKRKAEAELEKARAGARQEDLLIAREALKEAEILVNSSKIDLVNSIKSTSDFLDKKVSELDIFFTDPDLRNSINLNNNKIKDKRAKEIEDARFALNIKLDKVYSFAKQIKGATDITDMKTVDVLHSGELVSETLADIQDLINMLEQAAQDALDIWPKDPSLLAIQNKMYDLRPKFSAEKQSIDKYISALQLAYSKYKQSEANLNKLLAGTRPEDIKALEAALELAKAQVSAAQSKLSKASITAPVSGTVSKLYKEQGEYVNSMEPILSIITDGVYVKADVPEVDISKIKQGMDVDLRFDAYKSKRFKGTVYFISPAQKEKNNIVYYEIKILIDDKDAKKYEILPGMTATVFVPTVNKEAKLALPKSIIRKDDKGSFVMVLDPKAVNPFLPQKKYLKLGDTDGKYVEILDGIKSSDKVIVD